MGLVCGYLWFHPGLPSQDYSIQYAITPAPQPRMHLIHPQNGLVDVMDRCPFILSCHPTLSSVPNCFRWSLVEYIICMRERCLEVKWFWRVFKPICRVATSSFSLRCVSPASPNWSSSLELFRLMLPSTNALQTYPAETSITSSLAVGHSPFLYCSPFTH